MEENQTKTKKKGMGPLKGLLVALLIVFLACVIGLLIRMVVADDGDFFKPIKGIFGIEDEEEDDDDKDSKKSKKTDVDDDDDEEVKKNSKKSSGKSKVESAGRYALLSDDVEDEDVKHYRLTVDMGKIFKKVMKEFNSVNTSNSSYDFDDLEDQVEDLENEKYSSNDAFENLESVMGTAMILLNQMGDLIDGEMYFDIYFEGNEIVQIVVGYDYMDFLENFYDYMLENAEDELDDEGISSVDDFAELMVEQFDEILDEDTLYDMVLENADEDIEAELKEFGIKEKDIKDAVDFNNDKGIIEIYINGTTKLKAILSMAIESEDFKESLDEMEEETGVKVDEDNIIESIIKAANATEGYEEFGFKFVEVK